MSGQKPGPLVSVDWLKAELEKPEHNICLLDATWSSERPGREIYQQKHIPGALHFDVNHGVTPTGFIPRNLPDPLSFTDYLQSLGVSTSSNVVLYDKNKMKFAGRAWWLFKTHGHPKVSILHGGISQWEAKGYDVTSEPTTGTKKGDFQVNLQRKFVRTFYDIKTNLQTRREQLLDSQSAADFVGASEPSSNTCSAMKTWGLAPPTDMKAGHIPGSCNIPITSVYAENGELLKSKNQLLHLYESAGLDVSRPLVTTCYTGQSSCLMALIAEFLGFPDISMYYGSWTEYGQRADDSMVESGEK